MTASPADMPGAAPVARPKEDQAPLEAEEMLVEELIQLRERVETLTERVGELEKIVAKNGPPPARERLDPKILEFLRLNRLRMNAGTIAENLGEGPSSVQTALRRMASRGVIGVEKKTGRTTVYFWKPPRR